MNRRSFLSTSLAGALLPQAAAAQPAPVKLGIDLFSIRSQNWSPIEYLEYAAKQQAKVVHFSEIRFIGSLEKDNLLKVRRRAEELGIEVEIGMRSLCPTSKMFDAKAGSADEQLQRMITAATTVGSKIVRAVLGSSDDRKPGPLSRHIESLSTVLRGARSRVTDAGLKIAIENHAGDMQSHQLKTLIEESGKDFVGACLDSGNPLWTLEDPIVALETLYPYVLTSHVRDSAVWRVPEGAAVAWTRMGDGNVRIDDYVRQYVAKCPGKALSLEVIVTGPRVFPFKDPGFWEAYRDVPAWEFERFLELADKGNPRPAPPRAANQEESRRREREDLEVSLAYTKKLIGMG